MAPPLHKLLVCNEKFCSLYLIVQEGASPISTSLYYFNSFSLSPPLQTSTKWPRMALRVNLDFSKLSDWPRFSRLPRACTVQCLRKVILNLFPSMIFSVCSSHLHQMIFQSIILMIIEIFQTKDHHMNALHAKAVVVNLVQYDVIFLWSIIFPSSNIWSNMWNVFAINYETYCLLCQM